MSLAKFACGLLLVVSYGALVVYDMKNDRYVRYDERRCSQKFSPKSTFKIPNSLVGLETGVIRDAEFVIHWNREKYPPQANWNQEPFAHWGKDQTLLSAIKHSVLWYYRELVLRVGGHQMKKYVTAFDYGNEDVSGRVDNFWLNNVLKISTVLSGACSELDVDGLSCKHE